LDALIKELARYVATWATSVARKGVDHGTDCPACRCPADAFGWGHIAGHIRHRVFPPALFIRALLDADLPDYVATYREIDEEVRKGNTELFVAVTHTYLARHLADIAAVYLAPTGRKK
jgi:hypothetical protein